MKINHRKEDQPLSDLEGAALAALAQHGSATSYQLAAEFAASPSEFWSGSSGAIYPMMTRLKKRGLISGKAGHQGARARVLWSLTASGRHALMGWLMDVERASGMGFDPLRTRLIHIDLIPSEARAGFLAAVTERTRSKATESGFDDRPQSQRVHTHWMESRMAWLKQVRANLLK
jgi:DNA-binding PadR family transcriptional regulator